ncbi:MAG: hypothetical protein V4443_05115 [Pseudomonadota bacterium]
MRKRLLTLALLAVSNCALSEDKLSIGTGTEFSSTRYGGVTPTDIFQVPVTARYASGKLVVKLTVPYISVTGPGNVISGVGRINAAQPTATTTESGLGDVVASAGYNFYNSSSVILDLVGKIKFGTASYQKRLGTGENDYSAQVDGYHPISNTTIFETLGYKIVGDPPGVELNNVAYGAIGVSQRLSAATSVGTALDIAQSPSPFSPSSRQLTAYLTQGISNGMKVQVRVVKGFTDSSPNLGLGLIFIGAY